MDSLEKAFAEIFDNLPKLPKLGREWLAKNIWWMALLATIIGVLSIFPLFIVVFGIGIIASLFGGPIGIVLSGTLLVAAIVSMSYAIILTIITALAVSPLKAGRKKGWDYLFLLQLLGLLVIILNFAFTFEPTSFILGLFGFSISGYLLFQIRNLFGDKSTKQNQRPTEKNTAH